MDDASGGETRAVVDSFDDDRIVYTRHRQPLGMARNNLAGFALARGRYVANLHDDDVWRPNMLEKLVAQFERYPAVVVAFADHDVVDESGRLDEAASEATSRVWGRSGLASGVHRPFDDLAVVRQSVPMSLSAVFRRDSIDWADFPEEVGSCYPLWLAYLAARTGLGACFLPDRLASYRVHPNSETASQRMRGSRSAVYVYERFLQDPGLASYYPALRQLYASSCATWAISLLRSGDTNAARRVLFLSFRERATLRAAGAIAVSFLPGRASKAVSKKLHRR